MMLKTQYVDVIFEREREKSSLVTEYEDELRRLHELAGYELHKSVEAGQSKTIEGAAFRGMVLRIWEQYRGSQSSSTPLTQTVDEIIKAAANRLVFLSGKGEEQSDIDFLIQSYREYFAAQYLANHADADQSRVLGVLVGRGFFWSNVLQFYIGLAKPAEQITWMHSCSEVTAGPAVDIQKVVSLIQSRRSLMQCLPEFSKPSKANFSTAIQIAFSTNTRWTWYGHDWVTKILTSLRSTEARHTLLSQLIPMTLGDSGTFAVEAEICSSLTGESDAEYPKLLGELQKALAVESTRPIAISVAYSHSLPLSTNALPPEQDEAVVSDMIRGWRRTTRDPMSAVGKPISLSDSQLIQLLCRNPTLVKRFPSYTSQATRLLPKQLIPLRPDHGDSSEDGFEASRLPLAPYALRTTPSALSEPRESILGAGPYSDYLFSLAAAASDPTNHEKDIAARTAEALPRPVAAYYSANAFLGPDQSYFSSLDSWRNFKSTLTAFLANTEERKATFQLLADSRHRSKATFPIWVLTLFNPVGWDLCSECELVTQDSVDALRTTPVHGLLSIPTKPPSILMGVGFPDMDSPDHPRLLVALIKTACKIAATYGVNCVGSVHPLLARIFHTIGGEFDINAIDVNATLAAQPNLHTSWHALCFWMLVSTYNCPTHVLIEAWRRTSRTNMLMMKPFGSAVITPPKVAELAIEVLHQPTRENLLLFGVFSIIAGKLARRSSSGGAVLG